MSKSDWELKRAHENSRLSVGDECWLLSGFCLYCVVVTEVRVTLAGEQDEFAMYRVMSQEFSGFFEDKSQHRSDLFRRSDERPALLVELAHQIAGLQALQEEMTEATL